MTVALHKQGPNLRKEFTLEQAIEVEGLANNHCHLREGPVVPDLVRLAVQGGADVLAPMPNTQNGLRTAEEVNGYIRAATLQAPEDRTMEFISIVLLTEETTEGKIEECVGHGIRDSKCYPLGRTTNSLRLGVRNYGGLLSIVRFCGRAGMKCRFHPEHPWKMFSNRDAEFAFLPIVDMLLQETEATIIWEHGTDGRCIPFWEEMAKKSGRFFVTLTAHHLAGNEDRAFGDVRSVCKPPIKTERDREDLCWLVAQDYPWVMAGLDDAPHPKDKKHVSQGQCACGAYTAPFGLQLYAHALDSLLRTPEGVRTFVNFTSRNTRRVHRLMPSSRTIRLTRQLFHIPETYAVGPWTVEPFLAGDNLRWSISG